MNILIIGSKGFIGSHCVAYLKADHAIWQCDVVVDYTTPNYLQIDAANADYVDVFKQHEFDVCVNCSGAASVPDSITHPRRDFILNVHNVFLQLDALRKYNSQCKYINLSSAAVYGNPNYLPIDELHQLQPISPYGIHKKMSEDICLSFYKNYDIATLSLRIFSAYGAGLKKQLLWDLHKKANLRQLKIELFGTGKESRDFIHISDIVKAIALVIKEASFNGGAINVGSGEETTIKTIAKAFYNIYDADVNISFQGQSRLGDPNNWVANMAKLKSFGFRTSTTLNEGLENYIEWVKGLK